MAPIRKELALNLMLEAAGSEIRISKAAERRLKEAEMLWKLLLPHVTTFFLGFGKTMVCKAWD